MTALITRYGRPVAVFAATTVAPVVVLALVAVALGMVRTAALLLFGALAGLKVLMTRLERAGDACPGPRLVPASSTGGVR